MKKDEATFFLKEVFGELKKDYPNLEYATFSNGSVGFFSKDGDGVGDIVALAPVVTQRFPKEKRVEYYIDCLQILKRGCAEYADSYDIGNVLGVVSIEERDVMSRFRQSIKGDIFRIIGVRMKQE